MDNTEKDRNLELTHVDDNEVLKAPAKVYNKENLDLTHVKVTSDEVFNAPTEVHTKA